MSHDQQDQPRLPVPLTPHHPAPPLQKAESEELETQKPQVKLRRTVSEVVRPASTPPIIASAIKDDDDEDRIIAELEVRAGGAAGRPSLPAQEAMPTLPCLFMRGCTRLPAPVGSTLGSGPGNDIPSISTAVGLPFLTCLPAGARCHGDGQHGAVAPCRTPCRVQVLRAWFTVLSSALPPRLGL